MLFVYQHALTSHLSPQMTSDVSCIGNWDLWQQFERIEHLVNGIRDSYEIWRRWQKWMSSCVCKILFKSVQVCGGCCKMFRGLTFLGHSVEKHTIQYNMYVTGTCLPAWRRRRRCWHAASAPAGGSDWREGRSCARWRSARTRSRLSRRSPDCLASPQPRPPCTSRPRPAYSSACKVVFDCRKHEHASLMSTPADKCAFYLPWIRAEFPPPFLLSSRPSPLEVSHYPSFLLSPTLPS